METVKPLTWEEANKVSEEIREKSFPYPNHPMYDSVKEFIAWGYERGAFRVRALEEELAKAKEELQSWKDEHAQIVDDYGNVLKDKDEKIERLQERLEAAENDSVEFTKWVRDVGHMHPYASRSTKQLLEVWNETKTATPKEK